MEFDEMKKIWDSQNNMTLYTINEEALHKRILSKKKEGYHITNISELLVIIVFFCTGCFIVWVNSTNQNGGIYMYILAAWMFGSSLFVLMKRIFRIRKTPQFDQTLSGDLDHAILTAGYQVRFSRIMRWNILPIAVLTELGVWAAGKSIWVIAGLFAFFALTYFAGGWEHNIYVSRKRELEKLRDNLENENPGATSSNA